MSKKTGTSTKDLVLFVDADFTSRSRWVIGLLMANWIALGLVMGSVMESNPPLAYGAGVAGILTIIAGAAKLRGARISSTSPLVEVAGGRFRVRQPTSRVFRSVALEKLSHANRNGKVLTLVGHDGETQKVSLRGLSEEDQLTLQETLEARLDS